VTAKFFVMWAACAAALALAAIRAMPYVRPILSAPSADRWDKPGERLAGVLADLGLHRRLLTIRHSGALHAMIFAGFLVLFSAIIQSFGSGLIPGFSLQPIGGNTWIALLQDVFAVVITIGIGLAAWQRQFLRPKRFEGSNATDAWIIYGLVLAVVVTMLLEFAFRLAAQNELSAWRPVSSVIARAILAAGIRHDTAQLGSAVAYWLHVAAVLGFLVYIPGSKHRHIFTAAPNIFFRNLRPKGELASAAPGETSSGVAEISQFDWKHRLDLISCTECGRCQAACPAFASGLPLSPKTLIMDLRDRMVAEQTGHDQGPLIGGTISEETLWSCTTCRACIDACPVHIEQMPKIIEMRRSLIETGAIEPMLQTALGNLQQYGNSFGKPARQRARWTKDLGFPVKNALKEHVDVLWFVGDFASFDPRAQKITAHVARLLHTAGVDFGILFEAERNAGNDVRRVGDEGMFETLAKANIELLEQCSFRRIMTTDPHTLNALRQEYGTFDHRYDVIHYTQLLDEIIRENRLILKKGAGNRVTYHDPCYLGRYNGGFEAPRALIAATGHSLHEMGRCRENSFCCGAGGGRIWMDDSAMIERPSENRIKEALALGDIDTFVVCCPKDLVMYSAAVQNLGVQDRIVVRDISELIVAEPLN
jgi:Fe-S oxidoreductase